MGVKVTPEEAFTRFQRGMAGAGEKIKYGVLNTTRSQSANAIAAKDRMIANHAESMAKGKWEKGLREAGDEKWANNLLVKGVGKITQGITANEAEIKAKFVKVVDTGNKVRAAVENMPKGTIEDSLNRVRTSMQIQKDSWEK